MCYLVSTKNLLEYLMAIYRCLTCNAKIPAVNEKGGFPFCNSQCCDKRMRDNPHEVYGSRWDTYDADFELKEKATKLADQYNTEETWVLRAMLACREVGVSLDYVEDRYLKKTGISKNAKVDAEFRRMYHFNEKR